MSVVKSVREREGLGVLDECRWNRPWKLCVCFVKAYRRTRAVRFTWYAQIEISFIKNLIVVFSSYTMYSPAGSCRPLSKVQIHSCPSLALGMSRGQGLQGTQVVLALSNEWCREWELADFGVCKQQYTDKLVLICENNNLWTDDYLNSPYAHFFFVMTHIISDARAHSCTYVTT